MATDKVTIGHQIKECRRCKTNKLLSSFPKNERYAGGYGTWCKDCHREANKRWYAENKEKQNAKSVIWAKENPSSARAFQKKWRDENKDEISKKHAQWQRNNLDKLRSIAARRRSAKLMATPAWADMGAIDAIYKNAIRLQEKTGVRKHVDHIVPLQSKIVCGLHVVANLQILDGEENERKKNYRWPDMP